MVDMDEGRVGHIYRSMLRARRLEESLAEALNSGKSVHVGHPSSGQEAVAAGLCTALSKEDRLYCGHRAKHWAISKGCDLKRLAAEYCGKTTGFCGGWGGEMHMLDKSVAFMGSNHVVGSALPVAVGSALAAKLEGSRRVTVVAFGDGASVQGSFHEALNLAAIWQLPVLFVCENNHYAESTPVEYFSSPPEIYKKAASYDIPARWVDGQDALVVYELGSRMLADMREDGGPRFIEASTYRFLGHYYGDDTMRYRTPEEERAWRLRDPLQLFPKLAEERGLLSSETLARIRAEVDDEVAEAMEFADESPFPDAPEFVTSPYSCNP